MRSASCLGLSSLISIVYFRALLCSPVFRVLAVLNSSITLQLKTKVYKRDIYASETYMTIHNRLAAVRKERKFTQGEFSKKLGISRSAYINYERGDRELPSSFVVKLHELFSIDPTWLLTGEGVQSSERKDELVEAAVLAVRSYAMLNKREIDPKREAELVVLIVEYFDEGGSVDSNFVQNLLENVT